MAEKSGVRRIKIRRGLQVVKRGTVGSGIAQVVRQSRRGAGRVATETPGAAAARALVRLGKVRAVDLSE